MNSVFSSILLILFSLFSTTVFAKNDRNKISDSVPKFLCDDSKTEDKLDNSCPYYLCGDQVKLNTSHLSRTEVCKGVKLYLCNDAKTEVADPSNCPEYTCPDGTNTTNPATCD